MSATQLTLWRAAAHQWAAEGDGHRYGRWQDKEGAVRQAERWLRRDEALDVWLERVTTTGSVERVDIDLAQSGRKEGAKEGAKIVVDGRVIAETVMRRAGGAER